MSKKVIEERYFANDITQTKVPTTLDFGYAVKNVIFTMNEASKKQ